MLGNGRPFVLEIKNPKIRRINLNVIKEKINMLNIQRDKQVIEVINKMSWFLNSWDIQNPGIKIITDPDWLECFYMGSALKVKIGPEIPYEYFPFDIFNQST